MGVCKATEILSEGEGGGEGGEGKQKPPQHAQSKKTKRSQKMGSHLYKVAQC